MKTEENRLNLLKTKENKNEIKIKVVMLILFLTFEGVLVGFYNMIRTKIYKSRLLQV